VHGFHRHDNVVAGETNRASSGITVTVFPRELRGVAVDLTSSGGIGGGAMPILIGCVEGNFERVATLMNAELEHPARSGTFCLRIRRRTLPVPRPELS